MGDQLISVDNLLSNILLFDQDKRAERRITPISIKRCLLPHSVMMKSEGWSSLVYASLLPLSKNHIRIEVSEGVVNGSPFRLDPPNSLRGNFSVWMAFSNMWKGVRKRAYYDRGKFRRYLTRMEASIASSLMRSGVSSTYAERDKLKIPITDLDPTICQLATLEATLWDIHTIRARDLNVMVQKSDSYDYQENPYFVSSTLPPELQMGIDMVLMGPLVYLKVGEWTCCFTKVHFERLCKLLRTFLLLAITFPTLEMKVDFIEFVDEFWASISEIVHSDVDFLGECLKASKAMIIASLDDSSIPGRPLVDMYSDAIKPERRRYARMLASTIQRMTKDPLVSVNLTNIFKAFPHPDANMYELFRSIEGVRNPNQVDMELVDRFEGVLRRSIFSSLTQQGIDVRVEATDPASEEIQRATFATTRRDATLRTFMHSTWFTTRFQPIRHFIDLTNIEVKASSKSSQKAPDFEQDDLLQSIEYMAGGDVAEPSFLGEARTVNDATSDLLGESQLKPDVAIDRFLRVVELHKEFEEGFPGVPIDDIPPEALSEFVENNPSARYLVGTEPKFGEVHKKVTRMFYMAQQYLKIITQVLERYTKQICRKQPGVSITKSYPARRRDLENFCHSMTGSESDKKSVFVSFDMSEFSKKFPMELVRRFGQVLSELSGQKWMERIDLVFRASIVIHNSRGFFSKLSGIRGGFEGFFNFIWSSIHITIMEIALESTGLQGETLVYSDDGILMFYAPSDWTNDMIWERVVRIQGIYERLGLNFHLGKSMVSYNVWEYLGDVCYNNRLVPMWLKEICSITRNVKNRGLEPFYTKVKAIQSQCDAAVMAGAPVLHSYIIKRFFFGSMLDRLGVTYLPQLEELLAIVPSSAGGLRITSPFESAFMGTIERDAEILADIELLKTMDYELACVIVSGIRDNLRYSGQVAQAIISGTRFITHHPDVSGMKAINDCIDLIKNHGRTVKAFPSNPMGTEFKRDLQGLLETLEDINLDVITEFIYSTPVWTEYSNSMAVVRSSGVLRLVPRQDIMKLQARDTKAVKESIDMWYEYLIRNRRSVSNANTTRLLEYCEVRIFKDLRVAPVRPSPRMALTRGKGPEGIIVRLEVFGGETYYSQPYVEPLLKLSKDDTTLAWASEGVLSSQSRSVRKFMNSIARILSFSPESEGALINIGKLIKVEIPAIPPGLHRGAQRMGAGHGRDVDAKIFLPRWFAALSEARYVGDDIVGIYNMPRADRTTYLEAARVMSYFIHCMRFGMTKVPDPGQYRYEFSIDPNLISLMHTTIPMIMRADFIPNHPLVPLSEDVRKEYISSYKEYVDNSFKEIAMSDSAYLKNHAEGCDMAMIKEIYTASMKDWLVSLRRNSRHTLLNSGTIPLPRIEAVGVILDAVVEASLSLIPPTSRRSLLDQLYNWFTMLDRSAISDDDIINVPRDIIDSRHFGQFTAEVRELIELLLENAPDEFPSIQLGNYAQTSTIILRKLVKYSNNMDFFMKNKIVIIRPARYAPTKITPSHRSAFKEAFTATLSSVFSVCRDMGWRTDEIQKKLKIAMNVDELITALQLTRGLLRASEHRTAYKPYNPQSARIELFKFFQLVNQCIRQRRIMRRAQEEYKDEEEKEFMSRFTLPDWLVEKVEKRLDIKEHRVDHLAMLREPIVGWMHSRAREYVRAAMQNRRMGPGYDIDYDFPLYETNNILSVFYEALIVPAAKSLVEYSAELEDRVLRTFNPSTPAAVEMMSLSTALQDISGNPLPLDQISPNELTDIVNLIKMHTNDICVRSFIAGIRACKGSGHEVPMIISDHYDATGYKVALRSEEAMISERPDLWIYVLEHNDPGYALSDFIILSKCPKSSASVVKIQGEERYIVIAVVDQILEVAGAFFMSEPPITASLGVDLRTIIPEISLTAQARHIKAMTDILTIRSSNPAEAFNKIRMITTRTRRVDRRKQVVESDAILLASYNLVNESVTNDSIFGAYIGIIMWLRGENDPRLIGRYCNAIRSRIESANESAKFKILLDVANTCQWLSQSNLTSGITVDDSEVRNLSTALRGVQLYYRIPPSGIIANLKTVSEVRENLHGLTGLLGNISPNLYSVEAVRMIQAPSSYIDEQEQQAVSDLADLL